MIHANPVVTKLDLALDLYYVLAAGEHSTPAEDLEATAERLVCEAAELIELRGAELIELRGAEADAL